ncbi:hypothetical protein [Phenylobacterium sp.]|uniref:hypothetical protein n=1 Tax=Phenylobacterium sp. TaxID=1871053 RepID=UPI001217A8C9|nr:hypothetical protein [Phenylobacterium sp.]THD68269.1 MAG: hypothetical protein E8A12_04795 [Phenylobacterium sp.]
MASISSLDTVLAYAGDALWVIALAVMFAASRHAWGQTADRERLAFLGGQAPRAVALWLLPMATFAASLWLVLQARETDGDLAVIVFGVRAVSAALLALLHLRWVAQALKS